MSDATALTASVLGLCSRSPLRSSASRDPSKLPLTPAALVNPWSEVTATDLRVTESTAIATIVVTGGGTYTLQCVHRDGVGGNMIDVDTPCVWTREVATVAGGIAMLRSMRAETMFHRVAYQMGAIARGWEAAPWILLVYLAVLEAPLDALCRSFYCNRLGEALEWKGKFKLSVRAYEAGLEAARASGDAHQLDVLLLNTGIACRRAGKCSASEAYHWERLRRLRTTRCEDYDPLLKTLMDGMTPEVGLILMNLLVMADTSTVEGLFECEDFSEVKTRLGNRFGIKDASRQVQQWRRTHRENALAQARKELRDAFEKDTVLHACSPPPRPPSPEIVRPPERAPVERRSPERRPSATLPRKKAPVATEEKSPVVTEKKAPAKKKKKKKADEEEREEVRKALSLASVAEHARRLVAQEEARVAHEEHKREMRRLAVAIGGCA